MARSKKSNRKHFLQEFIQRYWDKIILGFLVTLYSAVLGALSVLRHNAFASGFDLSNMDQTLWFTLNGHFFSFRFPEEIVSRFAVHADLILVLISPLYLIWDDVRILMIFQAFALALGAIPTYLLSIKVLKNKIVALTIAAAYLLNPGMQWTNIYDFHAVSLAIPLFISAFYFAYTKKWAFYALAVCLALLTKEQISLNIAVLGMFVFFYFKQRTIGAITTVTGLAWFVTMVFIVMPYFSQNNAHWVLYEQGETDPKMLIEKYTDSALLVEQFVLEPESLNFYRLLIEPFGYLPIIGFPWLLLSTPDLFIAIMMDARHINLHYESGITPAIVIATIFGFYYLDKVSKKLKFFGSSHVILYLASGILILSALRSNYFYSPLPTTPSCWCFIYNVTDEDKAFEKALQKLPTEGVLTSSLEIRTHVNHRPVSFGVPSATDSADFIALITQNRLVGNYEPKLYENEVIPILLTSPYHKLLFKSEHFYLFERIKNSSTH